MGNPSFVAFIQELDHMDPAQVTPALVRRYNSFNEWRTKVLLRAEKKCRQLRMGGVPYSPEVAVAMKVIILWKHVLSRVKGGRYSIHHIQRLEKFTGAVDESSHRSRRCGQD